MMPSKTAQAWAVQGAAMLSRVETTEVLARYARSIRPQSNGSAGNQVAEHQDEIEVAEPADHPDRLQAAGDRHAVRESGCCPRRFVKAEGVPGELGSGDHVHADGRAQEDRAAHERAGQRHQDVLARTRHVRRADQAAQRPDVHLFLIAVEPVRRQGVGQLVQGQRQQQAARASTPSPRNCSRIALGRASDTAVATSRKTTKMTRAMWTRTAVPNHRPRLIGDQVRKSVMVPTRGRLRSRRETSLLSPWNLI